MSNTIFTFDVHQPYSEGPAFLTTRSAAQGGREVRRKGQDSELFAVFSAWLLFVTGGNSLSGFHTFFTDRDGGYDTFLYKPKLELFHKVTLEAVGTGDGAEDEFALDSKYIDSATLLVYVDGSLKETPGDYALTGNLTAPIIDFVVAPSNLDAVTATYERYYPCRFNQDRALYTPRSLGDTDAGSAMYCKNLTWRQDYPGSHLV